MDPIYVVLFSKYLPIEVRDVEEVLGALGIADIKLILSKHLFIKSIMCLLSHIVLQKKKSACKRQAQSRECPLILPRPKPDNSSDL